MGKRHLAKTYIALWEFEICYQLRLIYMSFILIPSNVFEADELKPSMNVTLLSSYLKCVVFNPTHTQCKLPVLNFMMTSYNSCCMYWPVFHLPDPAGYNTGKHFLEHTFCILLNCMKSKSTHTQSLWLLFSELHVHLCVYHWCSSQGKICPCSGRWWVSCCLLESKKKVHTFNFLLAHTY